MCMHDSGQRIQIVHVQALVWSIFDILCCTCDVKERVKLQTPLPFQTSTHFVMVIKLSLYFKGPTLFLPIHTLLDAAAPKWLLLLGGQLWRSLQDKRIQGWASMGGRGFLIRPVLAKELAQVHMDRIGSKKGLGFAAAVKHLSTLSLPSFIPFHPILTFCHPSYLSHWCTCSGGWWENWWCTREDCIFASASPQVMAIWQSAPAGDMVEHWPLSIGLCYKNALKQEWVCG